MSTDRYSRSARVLHWSSAALFLLLLGSGVAMQQMDPGSPRLTGYRVHALMGILAGLLTLVRIGRSFTADSPDKLPMRTLHALAFRAVHVGMLFASLVLVGSGIATLVGGPLLDLVTSDVSPTAFPDLLSQPPRIAHRIAAISFGVLLVGHVGGVLRYQFTEGDTLGRMGVRIPKKRTQP